MIQVFGASYHETNTSTIIMGLRKLPESVESLNYGHITDPNKVKINTGPVTYGILPYSLKIYVVPGTYRIFPHT